MPGDVEPPELARLVDFSERPRTHDWSLRSSLMRYAQPEPERVGKVLDLVRRLEFALQPQRKVIDREGPEIWAEIELGAEAPAGDHAALVDLLRVAALLDELGDTLAEWAVARAVPRPDAAVDAVTAEVERLLDALGVPREERVRPARGRG